MRHIEAVRILNVVGRIEDGTGASWGTRDTEETSVQDFEEYLKRRDVWEEMWVYGMVKLKWILKKRFWFYT